MKAQPPMRYDVSPYADSLAWESGGVQVTVHNESDQPVKLTLLLSEFTWWDCIAVRHANQNGAALRKVIHLCKLPTPFIGSQIRAAELNTDVATQPHLRIEFRYEAVPAGNLEFEQEMLDLDRVPVGESLEIVFKCRSVMPGPCKIIGCKRLFGLVSYSKKGIPVGGSGFVSYTMYARLGMNRKSMVVTTSNSEDKKVPTFQYERIEKPYHE